MQALLSQKDLTTTFAENLLKQFENEDFKDPKLLESAASNTDAINNNLMQRNLKSPPIKCEATSTSSTATSALLKKHEIKSEPVIKIEKLIDFDMKPTFSNKMTSKELYLAVK